MIFFGTRELRISTKQDELLKCPSCNEKGLEIFQFSKVVHIYWVPVIPYGKRTAAGCHNCGATFGQYQLKTYDLEHQWRKANIRGSHSPLSIAGLLIILSIAGGLWYVGSQDQEFNDLRQEEATDDDLLYNGIGNSIGETPHGVWYWKDGKGIKRIEGEFDMGKEIGVWSYWNEDGNLFKHETYHQGMLHGPYTTYYEDSTIESKVSYFENRVEGLYESWYDDQSNQARGYYHRGKEDSLWTYWYANGNKMEEGLYENGEQAGTWTGWYDNGNPEYEIEYGLNDELLVWNFWLEDGTQTVKAGIGTYKIHYPTGELETVGEIEAGKRSGKWTTYYMDSTKREEAHFEDEQFILDEYWLEDGTHLVTGGNGNFESYYDNGQLSTKGEYKNGRKNGEWNEYYDTGLQSRQENYAEGVLKGAINHWYETGKLYANGSYKNDLREGVWKWWWANGQKDSEVTYKKGVKEGKQTFWSEMGEKIKEETYENGELIDSRTF